MTIEESYPLVWPIGRPRTERPQWSNFRTTDAVATKGLYRELNLLGAKEVVVTSNAVRRNRDGRPSARQPRLTDAGVAVYFERQGRPLCFACDLWATVGDNTHAIALSIGAVRGLERWGSGQMVDAAFAGFAALPASVAGNAPWWAVLDLSPDATRADIDAAYRSLAKEAHPDRGGDPERFRVLTEAYEQGRRGQR